MLLKKSDLIIATGFVATVVAYSLHAAPVPMTPCEADGKNWATIEQSCPLNNEELSSCANTVPNGDPKTCVPPFVYTKRYKGNFKCYSSQAIGGQTGTCIQPLAPGGGKMMEPCLDKQKCKAEKPGVFDPWICVDDGPIVIVKEFVWTNVPCAVVAPGGN